MEKEYIIIKMKKKKSSGVFREKIVSDNSGMTIRFDSLIDAKDYMFHANIKSGVIFERASIQINTQGYDPTTN